MINAYSSNQISFGKLLVPKWEVFSKKQRLLCDNVKTVLHKPFPLDKKADSYMNFLEQKCNKDVLLRRGKKADELAISFIDKTDKKETSITYTQDDNLEDQVSMYCAILKKHHKDMKIIGSLLGLFIASLALMRLLLALASTVSQNSSSPFNNEQNTITIADSIKSAPVDTLDFYKTKP